MPKQADIDRILKVIQRKVLKGTHLPVEVKEIQARYFNSSHFKDIYLYLSQNRLLTSKATIRKVETFFIPNLIHYLRFYIKACHIYQEACNEKPTSKAAANLNKPKLHSLIKI